MATKSQIRAKALRLLGVVGVGVTPSGPQDSDMSDAYSEVYSELAELDLVEWAESDDIPARFVDTIVNLVASKRVDEYGVSNDRYQRIMNKTANAEAKIRRLISDSYIHNTTSFTDY